jgi:hypothetical protein
MWRINLIKNTVKVPKKLAKELYAVAQKAEKNGHENPWRSEDEVLSQGNLTFNYNHFEHMDYLASNNKIISFLKKNKVKGMVCFNCDEGGDQGGDSWGYEFDGNGKMNKLNGGFDWVRSK